MTTPTIDEMLAWLNEAAALWHKFRYRESTDIPEFAAIRAILELHRLPAFTEGMEFGRKQVELKAIRAFVERVEHRVEERYGFGLKAECKTMREELAAMERERNDDTN